ncbi:protein SERAC1-like [Lytechinus pictus]|uniref:protein SERAC1-like n=1 Tax=Lytechinus pictus TaxID=7653 RepID=UPI0030B9EB72
MYANKKPMRTILQFRRLYCTNSSSKAKSKFILFAGRRRVQIAALTTVAVGSGLLYIEWLTLDRAVHYKPDAVLPERGSEYIYVNAAVDRDDLVKQVKNKVHWRIKALEYILEDKETENVLPFRVPKFISGEKSHVWKDPKSLLKKAQSGDRLERLLGVAALSKKHTSWHDADYRAIAQACDSRTLIGLARSPDCDPRFFLPPPPLCKEQDQKVSIEAAFTKLLASLPRSNVDRCTQYFTMAAMQQSKKALAEDQTGSIVFGGNALSFVATLSKIPEEALDQVYLLALISHSEVSSHCEEIVKLGGLQLLMRVYQARENSPKILSHVAQIIANLATNQSVHDKIIQAGWVSVLAKWIKSKHLPLSAQASRALANLDRDWSSETFGNGVYVLHPKGRSSEPILADVVFVHGLSGGAFYTWRQGQPTNDDVLPEQPQHPSQPPSPTEDTDGQKDVEEKKKDNFVWCWPKSWLARDCPHMRIVTVSYDTQITDWASKCPFEGEKHSLAQRSGEMLRKLHDAGVGQRPIIWVTHSMGGLLVKQMLIDASQSETMAMVMGETKGVVFYSTPHHGSSLAAYSQQAKYLLYPSTEVKELSQDSPVLRNLHGRFRALVQTHQLPVLTFGESLPTNIGLSVKTLVVPPLSSNPGCGEFHEMPMDHQNICKPHSRNSLLYQLTLRFIQRNITLPLSVALSEKLDELLQDPEEEEVFYPLGMSFGE